MEERMITVVIPTYNRFECMKYFFENCFLTYTGKLFTFEIHDSSEDDRVKEYIDANIGESPILKYFKYDPSIDGNVKAMRAVQAVGSSYVYLLRDGLIVDFDKFEKALCSIDFEKYLIISLVFARINESFEILSAYDDIVKFCHENFTTLTSYGASFVNMKIINASISHLDKYFEFCSPFLYQCSLFEGLASCPGMCLNMKISFVRGNPCGAVSGWTKSKRQIEVFCFQYYKSVILLPSIYMPREKLLKCHNDERKLFSLKNSLRARGSGNITLKIIKKYKVYMKLTISHLWPIYLSLCFPPKLLFLFYKKRDANKRLKKI